MFILLPNFRSKEQAKKKEQHRIIFESVTSLTSADWERPDEVCFQSSDMSSISVGALTIGPIAMLPTKSLMQSKNLPWSCIVFTFMLVTVYKRPMATLHCANLFWYTNYRCHRWPFLNLWGRFNVNWMIYSVLFNKNEMLLCKWGQFETFKFW